MFPDNRRYCRAVVTNIGADTVTVALPGGQSAALDAYPEKGCDIRYLLPHLSRGMNLNLILPRELGHGRATAELIVAEPDYLVDITGVAECYETYTRSPLVSLLKRVKPETVTRHILLGGFAGQLLDEAVRSGGAIKQPYNTLATNFFRGNAVRIAVCDDLDREFHNNARCQKSNIEKAVSVSLRQMPQYDSDKIILEPSFFCEMLGLQGRMDLLQTDCSLLVEQKSGKGDLGSNDSGKPVHREPHLVQLILYQAILHYGLNIPNCDINPYLLYSRYPEPLLYERAVPQVLVSAMRMRNLLVCQELKIARADGINRLMTLSAESLHGDYVNPKFWEQWAKPDIESALRPILNADALSREYAARLFRFVALEQYYSKVGCDNNGAADGFAAAWKCTLEEKVNAGNIIHNLAIKAMVMDENNAVSGVTLAIPSDDNGEMPNFRTGDIVVLYPYAIGSVPDIRAGIVIRCSISDITDNMVTVTLRAPQTNRAFFNNREDKRWAMEHDVMDSSFKSLWRNINTFLAASPDRRELILGNRPARTDKSKTLSQSYGAFNQLVLNAKQAEEMFIVIGPPGTGKTSHGLMNILTEELADPASSALLGAYTNRAVDEICGKLTEAAIPFIRLGTSLGCSALYADSMIGAKVRQCDRIGQVRELLKSSRVIVGTTQSLTANMSLFNLRGFSLAIIDEASQILEPHIIGLLSATHAGQPAIRKFVLIGDHKQLPAVVKQSPEESAVDSETLRMIGLTDCRRSFFERQLDIIRRCHNGELPPQHVHSLSNQGRMHTDVAAIASEFFYDGNLGTVPLDHQTALIPQLPATNEIAESLNRFRNIFVDVAPDRPVTNDNANKREAKVIAMILKEIYLREQPSFNPERTVGVIVPYRTQIAAMKKEILNLRIPELQSITIDTVERFQGSQRDYIIYGFTIKRPDQFPFMTSTRFVENGRIIDRKLNVALTRSRSHNILVGDTRLLSSDHLYLKLLERFRTTGVVMTVDSAPAKELPPAH